LYENRSVSPRTAWRWIDVGAGDLAVSLSLRPAAAVSGTVTFKNGARPGGTLVLDLICESGRHWASVTAEPDGSFSFPVVRPGKYRISVSGAGYYAAAIRSGDAVLPDGVVNVEDGVETRLGIVASNEGGRLKGFATRDDQPAANMLVAAVPSDPARTYFTYGFQTDSDGSFDWPALPAGDYLLFAVDDPTVAFADAEAIKPYLAQAKPIRIEPGKVYEERVPIQAIAK